MTLRAYAVAIVNRLRANAVPLLCDLSGLSGCALIVYGTWRVFEPAGFIVAGAMLLTAAWFGAGRG